MESSNAARNLFKQLTQRFIEACGTSTKKQRTDSFLCKGGYRPCLVMGCLKRRCGCFCKTYENRSRVCMRISKGLSLKLFDKEFDLTEKDHEKARNAR